MLAMLRHAVVLQGTVPLLKIVAASDRHDNSLDALPKAAAAINDGEAPTSCTEQTVTHVFQHAGLLSITRARHVDLSAQNWTSCAACQPGPTTRAAEYRFGDQVARARRR